MRTWHGCILLLLAVLAAACPHSASASGHEGLGYGIAAASASLSTTQAGAHPDLTMRLELSRDPDTGVAFSGTRGVTVDLPPGLIATPASFPTCAIAQFLDSHEVDQVPCPAETQVGVLNIELSYGASVEESRVLTEPLYNLPPTDSAAARFGFFSFLTPQIVEFTTRPEEELGVEMRLQGAADLLVMSSAEVVVWGKPSDQSHDALRLTPREAVLCGYPCGAPEGSRPSEAGPLPLMTNPTRCGPNRIDFTVTPYALPDAVFRASADLPPIDGCAELGFPLDGAVTLTTESADSASGIRLALRVPSAGFEHADRLVPAALRHAAISLPAGFSLNVAAAAGMEGCSESQIGLLSSAPLRFSRQPAACPAASKVGSVKIRTPVLRDRLEGAVYLSTPFANPSGSLVAVYLVVERSGLRMKLSGRLLLDQGDGRLQAVFDQLPQLPLSELSIEFRGGPRGLLATPSTCGTYEVEAGLDSWGGQSKTLDSSFRTASGPAGAACPTGSFSPSFMAGTSSPVAGAPAELTMTVSRAPGEDRLERLETSLPPGLVADLSKVTICESIANVLCPRSSRIGSASVLAGVGAHPIRIPSLAAGAAPIYLAGRYAGAPLSLLIDLPVEAGPFDLGRVVVRAGMFFDSRSGQITVRSQPLPQFEEGVPISYRRVRLDLDRAGFIRNPTSCNPSRITSTLTSTAGLTAEASERFQVGSCERLRFRPRMRVALLGAPRPNGHPRLRLVVRGGRREAAIASAAALLPPTELLDSRHLRGVCSRKAFALRNCPPASVYGFAKLWTPLLDGPLQGPVYLREGPHRLPDLVAPLHGRIALQLVGSLDSVRGRLRATFKGLPDAPIEKLVISMKGGRRGLLVNNADLCRTRPEASVLLAAHDGSLRLARSAVGAGCG